MGGKNILGVDYKMYQVTYFIGMPLSVALYYIICQIFPPPGLGISESLPYNNDEVSEGSAPGEFTDIDEELAAQVEKR